MIRYQKDTNNIVTLTLDMRNRPINIINHEIGNAFQPVIEHLKQEKRRKAIRGVIVTSAKKTFLAGGDLEYLYHTNDPTELFNFCQNLKHTFRELESPGVPVVAAINGTALGSGFELALACHHRIVQNDPEIQLGLPEIQLGLIPGGGGVIRLMWLLGIEKAYRILTQGKRYSPLEALNAGIIDDLAQNHSELMEKANAWLLQTKEARRPWDRERGSIPGGTAKDWPLNQKIQQLTAELISSTQNNYPAPQAVLNVLAEGSKVDFDTAGRIESRYYLDLVKSQQCKNMIKSFWFDANTINAGISRPKGFGKFRAKKIGIIGAGRMGSGIAFSCLKNGLQVVLKDVSPLIAERGRNYITQQIDQQIQNGDLPEEKKKQLLKSIQTTDTAKDFEDCDVIIEAVFENPNVKQKVTQEAENYIDEYALFASNTLSIPITKLAEVSVRPENFVGLHFFAPAETSQLVEVVRGKKTSPETIARAFDFVKAIRKTPIIVKDDWGFFVARVQNTYILEGITLLQEGYPAALVENIGLQAGMPEGALRLADNLGLSMVLKYEQQAAAHYGSKYLQHPAVEVLVRMLEEWSRQGRQQQKGFYTYETSKTPRLWAELKDNFPVPPPRYDREELIERMLFAQVLEAIWCMQEGVIKTIEEVNLGSIYGWGFPAFTGGVIQYIENYGKEAFKKRCKKYEKTHGPRFKIPGKFEAILNY